MATEDKSGGRVIVATSQPRAMWKMVVIPAVLVSGGLGLGANAVRAGDFASGVILVTVATAVAITVGLVDWAVKRGRQGSRVVLDEGARMVTFTRPRAGAPASAADCVVAFGDVRSIRRLERRGAVRLVLSGTDLKGREATIRIDETFDGIGELWGAMRANFEERVFQPRYKGPW